MQADRWMRGTQDGMVWVSLDGAGARSYLDACEHWDTTARSRPLCRVLLLGQRHGMEERSRQAPAARAHWIPARDFRGAGEGRRRGNYGSTPCTACSVRPVSWFDPSAFFCLRRGGAARGTTSRAKTCLCSPRCPPGCGAATWKKWGRDYVGATTGEEVKSSPAGSSLLALFADTTLLALVPSSFQGGRTYVD
jgi:hypothetical protein